MTQRYELMQKMLGQQPGRDIDKECGYPATVTIAETKPLYEREGIARRVNNIEPDESWKKDPEVCETEDDEETEFEKAWKRLQKKRNLFNVLRRVDRLSGVGTFGILLLGIDDGQTLEKPVPGCDENKGVIKPTAKKHKLLYTRVFDEACVTISAFETDERNPRFGQPKMYQIDFIQQDKSGKSPEPPTKLTNVHWSRILHFADNRETSEIFGIPRMKDVYNRLYDLRKVLSSSGEMFWKGGFPGISFETNPNLEQVGEIDVESLREEFEKYQNGLQRYLALVGVQAKSLTVQVADPTAHFITHVKAICISKGIPWRIFVGTEEAKLAGDSDSTAWNERLKDRQTKYVAPCMLLPTIARLVQLNVLPMPKGTEDAEAGAEDGDEMEIEELITVTWPDLHTPSNADKAAVAKVLADAMAAYISGGLDQIMPPEIFLTDIIGMDPERAKAILEQAKEYIEETDGMHDHLHPDKSDAAEEDKQFEKDRTMEDAETQRALKERELDIKEKQVSAKAKPPAKKKR